MILDTTTKKLSLVMAEAMTTNDLPYVVCYTDNTTTTFTPISGDGTTNGTSTVDIVAAPASSTQRKIQYIMIDNTDTVTHTITLTYNNNGTLRQAIKLTLLVDETLIYTDKLGWQVKTSSGDKKKAGPLYIGSSFLPPNAQVMSVSGTQGPSGNYTLFQYVGTATKNATTCTAQFRVVVAASVITWTELGLFRAMPENLFYDDSTGVFGFLFERIGYNDMSAVWNTNGVKTSAISATINAGDNLYLGFGDNSSTNPTFRNTGVDDLDMHIFTQKSGTRPSTMTIKQKVPTAPGNNGIWCAIQLS